MTVLPPLLIAALSTTALAVLLVHRRANLGNAATLAFVASASAYGWARSLAVGWVSGALGSDAPYLVAAPAFTLAGAPLQEMVGWLTALALASYIADRLLRSLGWPADAWGTALAAGIVMAAVCLAVETAAVAAGWWVWTLSPAATGILRFPTIALLDWGFVAVDFLLPFELWRRRAPWWQRLAGLLLFPLHFTGHTMTVAWSEILPFSGFDLVHIGLLAFVGALALDARTNDSPWPGRDAEQAKLAPILGASLVLATTMGQLLAIAEPSLLWSGAPLALLMVVAMRADPKAVSAQGSLGHGKHPASMFLILLGLGLFLRLPDAIRAQEFGALVSRGAASLSAGRLEAGRADLRAALGLRPRHSEVQWLLGWAELQAGDRRAARAHLEAAVAGRLASVDAVRTLALLHLLEKRVRQARDLLDRRRAKFPETADLVYLAWVADAAGDGGSGSSPRSAQPAPIVASASAPALAQIFALAHALGDSATVQACLRRQRPPVAPDRP